MSQLHNAQQCTCQNGKPWDADNVCACACPKCNDYRASMLRLQRLRKIEERLTKSGIAPADLADLVWTLLEPSLQARIEKIVLDVLRAGLKDIRLSSVVQSSSLNW